MPNVENSPSYISPECGAQRRDVDIVRDVFAGTLRLRACGETYLPRFPLEDPRSYEARLCSAVLYNAYKRTIRGLTGMVFRKDVQLAEDVPEPMTKDAEDIDMTGRSLSTFAKDVFIDALNDGHADILLDMPRVEQQFRNRAEQERAGLRPFWTVVPKRRVTRFDFDTRGGEPILTEYAFSDMRWEKAGRFGKRAIEQIHEYLLLPGGVQFTLFEKVKKDGGEGEFKEIERFTLGGMPLIPVATVYANRTGLMMSEPPLLDLAIENIAHYQLRSDRMTSLHKAGVPIPILIGYPDDGDTIAVSSGHGITLPIGGDAKYLEPQGASLEETRMELQDIEKHMAALGLAMLQRDSRAAETAEAKRIEKAETDSQLASGVTGLEDGLEQAVFLHLLWRKLETSKHGVTANRDFELQQLSAQQVQVLSGLVDGAKLSVDTFWDLLVQGEVLPDSFDAELEKALIAGGEDLSMLAVLKETVDRMQQRAPARPNDPPVDED